MSNLSDLWESRSILGSVNFILRSEPIWVPLILPLFFLPSFDPSYSNLAAIGLLLALVPWGLRRWRLGYFTRRSPLDLPVLLLLFSAVMGIFIANLPEIALARFWVLVGSLIFYYLLINNARESYLRGYLVLLVLLGLLVSLVLVTQLSRFIIYPWGNKMLAILQPGFDWLLALPKIQFENVLFWEINRNSLAGVSMVLLPLTWSLFHLHPRWLVRGFVALSTFLLIAVLLFSAGVSAIFALCAGWFMIMLVSGKYLGAISMAGLLLLFPIAMLILFPGSVLFSYLLANIATRLDIWQSALYMIRDFPLTGVGLGIENWRLALPFYAVPRLSIIYNDQVDRLHMHAHNYYLQTWVEQGILGFIALVALVVVAFWLGARYLKSINGIRRMIVFGAFWSFAALSIQNLVDAGPSSPAVFGFWAVLGLMVAAGQEAQHQPGRGAKDELFEKQKISGINASAKLGFLSSTYLPGIFVWLGASFVLTLASLYSVGYNLILGLITALAAGLVLAKAVISSMSRSS
jgi:putative inorganic carbon (HCO3(-)) transporter